MAKATKKAPAKKTRKQLTPEEKEAKKLAQQEKYSEAVDKYVTINETGSGKNVVITAAMPIRGYGCFIRTTGPTGISEIFVPGMKIKTKKAWKTLVKDVPKKDRSKK